MSERSQMNGPTPRKLARSAGLRYTTDDEPGIRRRRCGRGFTYIAADGRTIRDEEVRARIKELVIPPAWTEVWINPNPKGHLQATGRDDRGRKQYLYHPRWREARDQLKFDRMIAFGETLPRIRKRVARDLCCDGMPRDKVLAAIVRLLEATGLRIGNKQYARENETFGLTTLRRRHLEIDGTAVRICFRGKGGKEIETGVEDRLLATILKQCDEIRGYEVFRYLDDGGEPRNLDATDVNAYIREAAGDNFTAKDFRTWTGSVHALLAIHAACRADPDADAEAQIVRAVDAVAEILSNTRDVCRSSYIHPGILQAHRDGWLLQAVGRPFPPSSNGDLAGAERDLLDVLRRIERQVQAA